MVERYYLDTSIWMDLYENRRGFNQEPFGDFAWKLLGIIKAKKQTLVISDMLIRELEMNYSIEEINGMMKLFEDILENITTTRNQRDEAKQIAAERNLPPGDVLHAIIARDHNLILITRNNHFKELVDISQHHKPEELI